MTELGIYGDKSRMKNFMGNDGLYIRSYKKIINTIVIYNMIIATFMHNYVNAIEFLQKGKVPAALVFGDSIVDPGNNNYIKTIGRADFPPYGRDFPGGVATGRFGNGKIPSDFFAEELGIKDFVPPYLDPTLNISDLLTGVSFASGAAGYDPKSAKLANVMTLQKQLNLFKRYIEKLKAAVGEKTTSTIISQSVYLISAGSNDITNTYFSSLPVERLRYNVSTYTGMMVNWASSFVQELYELGARRIGVISAPPCGCFPSQRTLHGGLFRSCVKDENEAAIIFNNKLFPELNSLNQKLAGSRFVYLDIYNPLLNLINNPSQSGFTVIDKGCCGTGKLEVTFLCTKLNIGTCKDASKYVFWDSFHPTEAAYKIIVHDVLQKSIANFF
ncbi:GDSL esterase/lipase EXL3-like [Chenopodium quinoa]|uniref:GDSL esterase/lipase EXL3-like n=1 Tax=Chenopodium quinoa TaxID=63459 RepID=UPI000B78E68C|nr:GDSL esterase/lipase EXL3-like [Chenopodium quinoa]